VHLAARALPDLDDRLRYRAEFEADLSVLGAGGQLRYAAGVLSRSFALRAALGASPARAEEDAMTVSTRRPFHWQCRILHWHEWVSRSAEDGTRYVACRRCGKEKDNIYTNLTMGA
jgi:hypothetical protein